MLYMHRGKKGVFFFMEEFYFFVFFSLFVFFFFFIFVQGFWITKCGSAGRVAFWSITDGSESSILEWYTLYFIGLQILSVQ